MMGIGISLEEVKELFFFFLKAIWEWTQAGGSFTDWQEENGVISEDAGL